MRTIRPVLLATLFTIATLEAFAQADISIAKSGSPAVVQAGSNITYTITATNNGPGTTSGVTITDEIPANTTFVSVSDPAGTGQNCFYPGGTTVTCTSTLSFSSGDMLTATLVVRVNPTTPGGTIISNTASASSSTADPNPANNSDTELTTVSLVPPTDADVYVSKTNAPTNRTLVGRGEVASYTITVGNDGPVTAANVTLSDTLPGGTTFESLVHNSGPVFSCTTPAVGAGGTITCTNPGLADQAESTFTLSVRLDTNAAGSIVNTATVSTTTPEPDTGDNSSSATITATNPGADVEITKTAAPASPSAGEIITYTVTATNVGSADASGLLVDDAVPANTTFVSASSVGTGAGCTPPQFTANGHVQCSTNFGTLPAGSGRVFTIRVRVNSDAVGATITNTATVSTTSDPNPANNSATAVTNVSPVPPATADISVAKGLGVGQMFPVVGPGETISYSISARNDGAAIAESFTLTDVLPASTTFESLSQTAGPTFNCTTPAVGAAGTVTCTVASLAVGAQANFTLVLRAAPNASGTISNTATVSSTTADSDTSDNSSTRVVTVSESTGADLRIAKTSTPANATPGQNLTYTVTIENIGSQFADEVSMRDEIPAQTTFVSVVEPPGTFADCFAPTATLPSVRCRVSGLSPGGGAFPFTFTVRVNDDATGSAINNTATATITGGGTDPDLSNNTVTIHSPLPPTTADLAVTKTTPDAFLARGDTATFTITLTNNGPLDAQNVTLTDAIPDGTTFESFVQNSGPAFTCTTAGTISCTNASFANGATATFTLTVRVATNAEGTITNTATATSQTPDHDNANNSASASFEATQPGADLDVTKTSDTTTVTPGNNITYTITVTNVGAETAASIAISDPIPASTTFVSVSDDGGAGTTCNPRVAGVVQCTIDALTPGQTRTITLVVNVDPNATGTISNTATVTSPSIDPDATNNAGTAATAVGPSSHANIPTVDPRVLALLAMALAVAGFLAVKS